MIEINIGISGYGTAITITGEDRWGRITFSNEEMFRNKKLLELLYLLQAKIEVLIDSIKDQDKTKGGKP